MNSARAAKERSVSHDFTGDNNNQAIGYWWTKHPSGSQGQGSNSDEIFGKSETVSQRQRTKQELE